MRQGQRQHGSQSARKTPLEKGSTAEAWPSDPAKNLKRLLASLIFEVQDGQKLVKIEHLRKNCPKPGIGAHANPEPLPGFKAGTAAHHPRKLEPLGPVNTYRAAATGADFFERKERGVANTGVF